MKYARPTYRALNTVDPALAKKTFLDYGVKFLHPIARTLVAKVRFLASFVLPVLLPSPSFYPFSAFSPTLLSFCCPLAPFD